MLQFVAVGVLGLFILLYQFVALLFCYGAKERVRKIPFGSVSGAWIVATLLKNNNYHMRILKSDRVGVSNYHPEKKRILLCSEVFDRKTLYSTFVALHEVRHVVQHQQFPWLYRFVRIWPRVCTGMFVCFFAAMLIASNEAQLVARHNASLLTSVFWLPVGGLIIWTELDANLFAFKEVIRRSQGSRKGLRPLALMIFDLMHGYISVCLLKPVFTSLLLSIVTYVFTLQRFIPS